MNTFRAGIDIGSTTVKLVVLDARKIAVVGILTSAAGVGRDALLVRFGLGGGDRRADWRGRGGLCGGRAVVVHVVGKGVGIGEP